MLQKISLRNIIIFLFVLISIDIYLLVDRFYTQKYMEKVELKLLEYNSFKNEIDYLNIGNFLNIKKISLDILKYKKSNIGYIILLTGRDCSSCITQELNKLNKEYEYYDITVFGYFLNNHRGVKWNIFKKVNNIRFPIKLVNRFPIYTSNIIKKTPLIIAVNFKTEKIIDIYEPFPNDILKSNAFYKRIESVLLSKNK